MDDTGQVGLDRVPVHGILQPGGKRGHHVVGIVTDPVKPPVHAPGTPSTHAHATPGPFRERYDSAPRGLPEAEPGPALPFPDPTLGLKARLEEDDMPGTERVEVTGPYG